MAVLTYANAPAPPAPIVRKWRQRVNWDRLIGICGVLVGVAGVVFNFVF